MKSVRLAILFSLLLAVANALGQSWQPLQNQPPVPLGSSFLMTDGTVLFQSPNEKDWWKLTPDPLNKGSYVTGTWSQIASLPGNFIAAGLNAGVLKDGRLAVPSAWDVQNTNSIPCGIIYDSVTNTWSRMSQQFQMGSDGDSLFSVLADGQVFASLFSGTSIWNPATSLWTPTNQGPIGNGEVEQQATLLPDGSLLFSYGAQAERYIPSTDQWVNAGTLPSGSDFPNEDGPSVLMFNGKVLTMVGDQLTDIYTPGATSSDPGSWAAGPPLPIDPTNGQLTAGDSPACLLPNGNVLLAAESGQFGTQFVEYNGSGWTEVPNPTHAYSVIPESVNLLVLPSSQVLYSDSQGQIQVYTPAGGPQSSWRPSITTAPAHITQTLDSMVQGTLFNGWSQTEAHGDDMDNATNYPLLRIINRATGHWSYARTHDHSSMGVATGSQIESTHFTVPWNTEPGYSYLEIEVNGMDSIAVPVMVDAKTVRSLTVNMPSAPSGTTITGTVTLVTAAPSGGITVNLSTSNGVANVPATVLVPAGATQASFPIKTLNATYSPLKSTITAAYSTESANTVGITVNPGNYAQFVSQNMPANLLLGQQVTVTVQFKNTGTTTWDTAHSYKIHSLAPVDNTNWGFNRIALSNPPVAPGGTGMFTTNIVAPSFATTYTFCWQMIQDDIGMAFGPGSTNLSVKIAPPPYAAKFISQTGVPTTIQTGAVFKPFITYENIGGDTWASPNYILKSRNPYSNTTWGTSSVALPTTTSTNNSVTFKPAFTAPSVPGTYNFQWSMMDTSTATLFGDMSPNVAIVVQPAPDSALYVSESNFSKSIGPGAVFSATITMKNIGTNTWNSNYSLGTANPTLNLLWGTVKIPVSGTVAPGATYAFTGSFTARTTPGSYHFDFQMLDVNTPFGQQTPDVVIVVSADAAHYVSTSSQPATIVAGKDFYAQYTMQNTGTTTWSGAGGYAMMSVSPNNNTTWSRSIINLPAPSIAPGANALMTGLCTAPIGPGTYTMQWQMEKAGVPFGEPTPLVHITVTLGADDAAFANQSGVPTSVPHGMTFQATITMTNLGTATWTGPTYSLVPIGNNTWGVASIPAGSVVQNANGTFTATFTAPATAGTYTFQMRMADGSTKFGQATPGVAITVT